MYFSGDVQYGPATLGAGNNFQTLYYQYLVYIVSRVTNGKAFFLRVLVQVPLNQLIFRVNCAGTSLGVSGSIFGALAPQLLTFQDSSWQQITAPA